MRGDAPLLVVVGDHQLVASGRPLTPFHGRHRWIGSQAVRAVLVALLIARIARLAAVAATSRAARRPSATGSARASRHPRRGKPGTSEAPSEPLDASKTYTLTFDTSCGSFTITLDPELAPETSASLVALAERRVLRRHDLPPRRSGLRHPGRRSDPDGGRRAGVLDGRRSAVERRLHEGRRSDGEVGSRGAGHGRQPVLRRQRRRRGPSARVRDRRRGHGRHRHGRARSTRSAWATARRRSRSSSRASPSARADGAGRRDRPRRRRGVAVRKPEAAHPAPTCARAARARRRWTRSSSSRARYELELPSDTVSQGAPARIVECPDWERGPGASLRCGLATLEPDVEAAVVVLADGPNLAPEAVERVLAEWRTKRWNRRGVLRRRTAATRSCSGEPTGRTSPTRAYATGRSRSSRATTSARRATSTPKKT